MKKAWCCFHTQKLRWLTTADSHHQQERIRIMSFFTEVNRNSKRRQAWTANFSAPFQHWHWTLPPERRFIFTNENTPCVSPIENWSKGATIPWKRLRIIQICREHCGNCLIKTKKVHASPSSKKDSRYSTASCNKFYDSFTNANTKARQDNNVGVTDHSKPKSTCPSI